MSMHPLIMSALVQDHQREAERRAADSRLAAEIRRSAAPVSRQPALRRTRRFRYRLSARAASAGVGR